MFEKVSVNDINKKYYNNIIIPKRSTINSAGYDFFMPYDMVLRTNEDNIINTGIKWRPDKPNTVLQIYPRSSIAFTCGFRLVNTVAIIDSDYYNNSINEGSIIIQCTVNSPYILKKGDKFVQGIIMPYDILDNEIEPTEIRKGGLGSTGK